MGNEAPSKSTILAAAPMLLMGPAGALSAMVVYAAAKYAADATLVNCFDD